MTPAQIKETKLYKSTLPKVLDIWPDKAEEYAKELAIASEAKEVFFFFDEENRIFEAFPWYCTPQGLKSWTALSKAIGE